MPAELLWLLVLVQCDLCVERDRAERCAQFVPGVAGELLQAAHGLGDRAKSETRCDETGQDNEQERDGSGPRGSLPQLLHVLLDRTHRRSQQERVHRAILQPAAGSDDTYDQIVTGWQGPVCVIWDDTGRGYVRGCHHTEHALCWVDGDSARLSILLLELQRIRHAGSGDGQCIVAQLERLCGS